MSSYPVPVAEARSEIREKGSVFLAVVAPAADEPAARAVLGRVEREEYGERARLRLRVRSELRQALLARLADLGIGAAQIACVPSPR